MFFLLIFLLASFLSDVHRLANYLSAHSLQCCHSRVYWGVPFFLFCAISSLKRFSLSGLIKWLHDDAEESLQKSTRPLSSSFQRVLKCKSTNIIPGNEFYFHCFWVLWIYFSWSLKVVNRKWNSTSLIRLKVSPSSRLNVNWLSGFPFN